MCRGNASAENEAITAQQPAVDSGVTAVTISAPPVGR